MLHLGKADASTLKDLLELPQLVPPEMAAELCIEMVHRFGSRVREQLRRLRLPHHVHKNQMLFSNQLDASDKTIGEARIIERSQTDDERAPAKPQPNEGEQLVVVRCDRLRLECIEGITARVVMRPAVAGRS